MPIRILPKAKKGYKRGQSKKAKGGRIGKQLGGGFARPLGVPGAAGAAGAPGVAGVGASIVRNIPAGNVITALDETGDVGWTTSITIGADGLGLISYLDATNDDLKVAHCDNTFCSPYFRRR